MESIMLNQDIIKEHINFDHLKMIVGNDEESFKGFLQVIKSELSNSLKDLENHYQSGDLAALKKAAHKLKGTALSAAMNKLSAIAIILNKPTEIAEGQLGEMMQQLREETTHILSLIHEKNQ
ncbi:MAG: hypothetical protein RLZZ28_1914 [Bacteroidota bacterium]|jgi:HPt (histidine-containing phosphotransfer) domain-containing protein